MIYKLILAPPFRNILLHSVYKISAFRYIAVFSIPVYKSPPSRSPENGDVPNNFILG